MKPSTTPTVLIERTFAFPREAVFDAWIQPNLLARWFAPNGCSLHFVRIDVREGGGFHSCIRTPDGFECWTVAIFQQLVRPERIVFTMQVADAQGNAVSARSQGQAPDWPDETTVTVTFTEANGRTLVRLAQNVSDALARRTGAHPSWIQMLDGLEKVLARQASEQPHA